LSVWVDEAALAAFTDRSPHRELMAAHAPAMGPTRFARWAITGSGGRPSWHDALRRLR